MVQGSATFYLGDGSTVKVGRFDGILLPKGTMYRFHSDEGENLVMLRVGGAQRDPNWSGEFYKGSPKEIRQTGVLTENGMVTDSQSLAKGKTNAEPVIPIPGKFFGRD